MSTWPTMYVYMYTMCITVQPQVLHSIVIIRLCSCCLQYSLVSYDRGFIHCHQRIIHDAVVKKGIDLAVSVRSLMWLCGRGKVVYTQLAVEQQSLVSEASFNLPLINGQSEFVYTVRIGASVMECRVHVLLVKYVTRQCIYRTVISTPFTQDGTTPLIIASQNGYSDIVNILIRNGASVNMTKKVRQILSVRAVLSLK